MTALADLDRAPWHVRQRVQARARAARSADRRLATAGARIVVPAMPRADLPEWLTAAQLATWRGLTVRYVYRLPIPRQQHAGQLRFRTVDVLAYIDGCAAATAQRRSERAAADSTRNRRARSAALRQRERDAAREKAEAEGALWSVLVALQTCRDWSFIADRARRLAECALDDELAAAVERLIGDAEAMQQPAGAGTDTTPRRVPA